MESLQQVLGALKAAAELTRLRLLALCANGDLTVSELCQILGQSQPRVSRHLKVLCDADVLERIPEGAWAFFRLKGEGPAVALAEVLRQHLDAGDPTLLLDENRLAEVQHQRAESARAYFRANAERWDKIRSMHVDESVVEQALIDALPPPPIKDLLDVGTGTGRMMQLFAASAVRAVGVDASREMLAMARANLDRARLQNCTLRSGDMYRLPWPGDSFDVVVIHMVLHFADQPAQAVAEAARVLRPGGRLLVADFAPHQVEALRSEHAHRRLGFADDEFSNWFDAAGLSAPAFTRLRGDPLTVTVCWALREPTEMAGTRSAKAVAGQ